MNNSSPPPANPAKGAYAFISLGCPKNLVDSERMLGQLQIEGYQLVEDPDGTDFVIVNTCGFIEQAREESFGAIDEMLELKRQGRTRGVIVAGCLAERQKEELLESRPQIDTLMGVFAREEVAEIADRLLGNMGEQRAVFRPAPIQTLPDRGRLRVTPSHFAYLKVSEGCDRLCTFCAIPRMRGKHVSKPMDEVVREAEELADDGVRELIIVAQDTTYYGLDLYQEPKLEGLLDQLDTIEGIDWIRLMYLYPMYITDSLIERIANSEKILPYVDLPLQHINDTMLRRMARRVSRSETESLIDRLRTAIPNLTFRTTFITGFPGETEAQFEELVEFVERQRFERVGVFTYSYEPDTPAGKLPDQIPDKVKIERRNRLMAVQQAIAFEQNQARVGKTLDIILDHAVPDQENVWVGRSTADAPEIDGVVYVTGHEMPLCEGQIVPCEIVTVQDYDLVAAAVGEPR